MAVPKSAEHRDKLLAFLLEELKLHVLPACHSEHVARLPEEATMLAFSKRGQNEIWHINQRVLCIQSHPEFNVFLI
jgi:GMP synthase-like glutamine amidotransferase